MGTLTYIGPDLEVEVRPLRRLVKQGEVVEDVDDSLLDVNNGGLSWPEGHWLVNGQPQAPQVFHIGEAGPELVDLPPGTSVSADPTTTTEVTE